MRRFFSWVADQSPVYLSMLLCLLICPLVSGLVWIAVNDDFQEQMDEYLALQQRQLLQRVDAVASNLEISLRRIDDLPILLAASADLQRALDGGPGEQNRVATDLLRTMTRLLDLELAVLFNERGDCLVSSEPRLIGRNYAYREYFQQAARGERGHEFVMGSVTARPGLMFSAQLQTPGGRRGVLGVKVGPLRLSRVVEHEQSLIINRDGVVVQASDVSLLLNRMADARVTELPEQVRQQRYWRKDFPLLPFRLWQHQGDLTLWQFAAETSPYLLAERQVSDYGFRILHYQRLDDYPGLIERWQHVRQQAAILAVLVTAGFIIGLVVLVRNRGREMLLAERLQLATDTTGVGIWDWDIPHDRLVWNSQMFALFGIASDEAECSYYTWQERIAPEDVPRVEAALRDALAGRREFALEFRVLLGVEASRHIRASAVMMRDHRGRGVRMLGSCFDITQLREQELALRAYRENLSELVAEQTRDLITARDEAQAANIAKTEFLSNISHELRTPMHAMLGFASLGATRVERLSTDKIRSYFEQIRDSGRRLLALLDDLLDLSKLDVGRMTFTMRPLQLESVLNDVRNEMLPLLEARRLSLDLVCMPVITEMRGDALRLTQLFRNLLTNAIRYTGEHTEIRVVIQASQLVRVHQTVPALRVTVADQGVGIPEDELESIFDKFSQSSRTRSKAGGTGLGLAICREIVLAHGGTIRAYNNRDGGATLDVVLPLVPPQVVALTVLDDAGDERSAGTPATDERMAPEVVATDMPAADALPAAPLAGEVPSLPEDRPSPPAA